MYYVRPKAYYIISFHVDLPSQIPHYRDNEAETLEGVALFGLDTISWKSASNVRRNVASGDFLFSEKTYNEIVDFTADHVEELWDLDTAFTKLHPLQILFQVFKYE